MADFGGWEMPIEYPAPIGGVINEHTGVRERAGLFDVSHLGKAEIGGPGAREFLNSIVTNDLSKIAPGQAQYTMLCDTDTGGVVDDLIVYLKSDEEILLVPNAANNEEVVRRISNAAPREISVRNAHEKYAVIALQGPQSDEIFSALGLSVNLEYMSFGEFDFAGEETIICRTGYTGERGYELLPAWNSAPVIWKRILDALEARGGVVAGLGARDTLRTEMCYPLHGHELSLTISPVEANAAWAVGWKKENFWGASPLKKQRSDGATRVLRPLVMFEKGIPRAGMNLLNPDGDSIGVVTSGTFSPTLKKGIALALIKPSIAIGEQVQIDIRGNLASALVAKAPLVPAHVR